MGELLVGRIVLAPVDAERHRDGGADRGGDEQGHRGPAASIVHPSHVELVERDRGPLWLVHVPYMHDALDPVLGELLETSGERLRRLDRRLLRPEDPQC